MADFSVDESWSFRDKSFVTAIMMSVLWHLFWFFSITITVNTGKMNFKPHPKVVSLPAVLDDSLFRALVENKPQLSETFYRRLSDYSQPTDIETKTIERRSPGEVVSLPFLNKKTNSLVHELVGGDKTTPKEEFQKRIRTNFLEDKGD